MSLISYIIIIAFAIVRGMEVKRTDIIPNPEKFNEYCLFANLIPEIAGLLVLGKILITFLLQPFSKLGYEIELVHKLMVARDKWSFTPINKIRLPETIDEEQQESH